MDYEEEGYF
jgi:hypothetical protein